MFGIKKEPIIEVIEIDPVEEVIRNISDIEKEKLFLLMKHIIRELDFRDDEEYENQEEG